MRPPPVWLSFAVAGFAAVMAITHLALGNGFWAIGLVAISATNVGIGLYNLKDRAHDPR